MHRRRRRDWLTLLGVFLAAALTLVAISASRWMTPRWLGLAVSAVGWTIFGLHNVGQGLLLWNLSRRPVARRPWILGGPPHPSPPRGSEEPDH